MEGRKHMIRPTIARIIEKCATFDEAARMICGYLSCECGLDNGNGWYDDDPEMSLGDDAGEDAESGLSKAEEAWLERGWR
jgi:hypothetical protein